MCGSCEGPAPWAVESLDLPPGFSYLPRRDLAAASGVVAPTLSEFDGRKRISDRLKNRQSSGVSVLRGRKCVSLMYRTFERAGVRLDMDRVLYRIFAEAGLQLRNMRIDVPLGDDPNIVRWLHDLLSTLFPRIPKADLDEIGDLDTLAARLEAERIAAGSFAACVGLVGAWARKPVRKPE